MSSSTHPIVERPLELRLSSGAKEKLVRQAAILGKNESVLAQELIEEKLASIVLPQQTADQRITQWKKWFASHTARPTLADDSREGIYR